MKKLICAAVLLTVPNTVLAAQILVRPTQSGRLNDVVAYSDAATSYLRPTSAFQVRLNVSCFGTNLRWVDNPISPYAAVKFDVQMDSGTEFSVVFPGWLVMKDKLLATDYVNDMITTLNGTGGLFAAKNVKNTIIFDIPSGYPTGAVFDAAGNLTNLDVYSKGVKNVFFRQDQTSAYGVKPAMNSFDRKQKGTPWLIEKFFASVLSPLKKLPWSESRTFAGGGGGDGGGTTEYIGIDSPVGTDIGWGQNPMWLPPSQPAPNAYEQRFFGRDGLLTGHWEISWSSDYKTMNVNVAFPGQKGFCGGYFSPLMFFFDSRMPQFDRTAKFKMSSYADQTTWPEPGTTAAFLVLDRNNDGIINDVTEMFGSEDEDTNGFELLKVYDENGDGVIDEKDPVFSHLKLWTDSTGAGITLKKDLKTLKEAGIESIPLNYDSNHFSSVGRRAELRQRAAFTYKKNGHKAQGEIIDVWFKGSN